MSIAKILVLGSTGSVGINTLKVIERFPDRFTVVGLSAFNNVELLARQIRQFSPKGVAVGPGNMNRLRREIKGKSVKVFDAATEIEDLIAFKKVDIV
ncbi:MAG: 1-deoxy-D-xylulose-5-phosphate reductoisomerase, partial [Candidatus Omnitrophica bacterium]|nr:1-deoxy-D-xylulose-5-phosphate reductoisomerase [Candidatus Omnitrophota bacterium]